MIPRRRWPVLALLGVVLQLSCDDPVCACPPARSHAIAYGNARTAAGAPVRGAEVKAYAFRERCGEDFREEIFERQVTNAAGEYELHFYSAYSPGTRCLRFVASRATPAGADSVVADGILAELRYERHTPARFRVDFVFP